jgi:ATP-dependent RNA helicase DeaD
MQLFSWRILKIFQPSRSFSFINGHPQDTLISLEKLSEFLPSIKHVLREKNFREYPHSSEYNPLLDRKIQNRESRFSSQTIREREGTIRKKFELKRPKSKNFIDNNSRDDSGVVNSFERKTALFKPISSRKQRSLIIPSGVIQTIKVEDSELVDFSQILSNNSLITKLIEQDIKVPTSIQKAFLQYMKSSKCDILVKAETGTGKSFGYIIASLEHILSNCSGRIENCRVLILVPNSILAQQIIGWARGLCSEISIGSDPNCSIMVLSGRPSKIRVALETGEAKINPELIIIDETDAMIKPLSRRPTAREEKSKKLHPNETISVLQFLRAKNPNVRIIYCTATMNTCTRWELKMASLIPKEGAIYLDATLGKSQEIDNRKTSASLPSTISHYYKVCNLADEECFLDALYMILQNEPSDARGLLLLPDGASKAELLQFLKDSFTDDLSESTTVDYMSNFNRQARLNIASYSDARGFDDSELKFVIILGLPPDTISYQHMAGRVGRMGRPGNVYTLLNSSNEFELHRYTSFSKFLGIAVTRFQPLS